MATGKTVITLDGIKALTTASITGRKTKPVYFKVSETDLGEIYPGIDLKDVPNAWYQAEISGYVLVNDNTVQFICEVPIEQAVKHGTFFGLFFEDGILFAVVKPPYPYPPLMRQRLLVQFVWQQIEAVMDFSAIPYYEFDQDVAHLDAVSTISLAIFDIQEHLTILEQFKADYYRNKPRWEEHDKKISNHEARITVNELKLEDHELAILEMMGTYGEQILKNSLDIGLLKQYIREV